MTGYCQLPLPFPLTIGAKKKGASFVVYLIEWEDYKGLQIFIRLPLTSKHRFTMSVVQKVTLKAEPGVEGHQDLVLKAAVPLTG